MLTLHQIAIEKEKCRWCVRKCKDKVQYALWKRGFVVKLYQLGVPTRNCYVIKIYPIYSVSLTKPLGCDSYPISKSYRKISFLVGTKYLSDISLYPYEKLSGMGTYSKPISGWIGLMTLFVAIKDFPMLVFCYFLSPEERI